MGSLKEAFDKIMGVDMGVDMGRDVSVGMGTDQTVETMKAIRDMENMLTKRMSLPPEYIDPAANVAKDSWQYGSIQSPNVMSHSHKINPKALSQGNIRAAFNPAPEDMIAMRLRVPHGAVLGFEFLKCYVTPEHAFVFIVHNGQECTIKDDPNLFPSDGLITQLRLLIG